MASTKSMKGGKFKFKKKDGTWSKKSFATKGAAMSAKRGSRGGAATRSGGGGDNGGNNKWGWGRWGKMARTIDVVSGPAQGALSQHGLTKDAGLSMAAKYTGVALDSGEFEIGQLTPTYGGIATGLGRDWARSKMGIYRGMGQKKLLSFAMGSNPEIMAYAEIDPFEDLEGFNGVRMDYDRGYQDWQNNWSLRSNRLWKSIGFDVVLRSVQHFLFDTTGPIGLNRMLPKGWNA